MLVLSTQSTKTKLDVLNTILGLLDLSTVITSTDTHQSRTVLSIMPSVLYLLEQELNWVELVTDTLVSELPPYVSPTVMNGALGWQFAYNFKVHGVYDTEYKKALCFQRPERFERDYRNHTPYAPTADITFMTVDADTYTVDADMTLNQPSVFTKYRNTVFIPNTLDWGRFKVTHTQPMTLPEADCDYFNMPDYIVHIFEVSTAYRYAAMYAPARNDIAAARVSGLRDLYGSLIVAARQNNTNKPIGYRGSVL